METQAKQILDHLNSGRTITPIDALEQYGCFRLAARIHDLKQAGHKIGKLVETEDGKRYARYYKAG